MKKIFIQIFLLIIVFSASAYNINRYDTKYMTLSSEHFDVFFRDGREKLANYIANLAEKAYLRYKVIFKMGLTSKVPIIIKSFDEYSFGDADPFSDQIVLNEFYSVYSNSGEKKVYDGLISHELAHIFTFKFLARKANVFKRTIAVGFLPLWLIEGIAQFLGEEWYDSYEGYMTNVALSDCFLSLSDLNSFYYVNSLGRHRGYIESFAFTRYLFEKLGDKETFYRFMLAYSHDPFNIEKAFFKIYKKDLNSLFVDFKDYWKNKVKSINKADIHKGLGLKYGSAYMRYPRFSPDGKVLAFVGDNNSGFNLRNHLYFYDLKKKRAKQVLENIDPYYSFSPDGKKIAYSHLYFSRRKKRFLYDVYVYDIKNMSKKRVTTDFSARFPCFLDNNTLAFVRYDPFGYGLYKLDLKNNKLIRIIKEGKSYYLYDLKGFGKDIIASCFDGNSRQIVLIDTKGNISPITNCRGDNRNFIRDDQASYFLTSNNEGKYKIVMCNIPRRNKMLTDILHIDNKKVLELGKFGYSISSFDVYKDKLAVSYFGYGKYILRLYDIDELTKKEFKFSSFKRISPVKMGLVKYKIEGYKKKINMEVITPWLEYYDEWKVGLLASSGDFLGFNRVIAKLYYNVKSKRIGEKFSLVSKSLPFTTNLSYENDVIRSRYGSSDYEKRKEKIDIQFDYPLNPWEEIFWGAETQNISSVKLDPVVYPLPFSGKINLLKIGYKYFKLRPSPDWDINPSDGKFIYLQLRRADDLINSDVNYSEIRAKWDNYISINHLGHTFVTRLSYGNKYHISNINTPILYGIGGVDTVRGFSTDTRFGTKYAIATAEYRIPLKVGILRPRMGYFYLNKLFGSVFFDSGNAWYSGKIKYSDFITSYGGELKLKSLLLGKVPIITRLGYAIREKYGHGSSTYLDFDIPIF